MTTPKVIGLDLSLRSTGVSNGTWCDRIQPGNLAGHDRLAFILAAVTNQTLFGPLVVIEGLALASQTGNASERAGLHWLVRHNLWRRMIPYAVVSPQAVKQFATGNGGASKDEVLAAVIKRWPHVEVTNNDEADALVLAAIGLDHLGHPTVTVPQTHRRALTKIAWPQGAAA